MLNYYAQGYFVYDSKKAGAVTVSHLRFGKDQELLKALRDADQSTPEGIEAQRRRVTALKELLKGKTDADLANLLSLSDYLIKRSIWAFGGDGWAYDIGYGGLDHVIASGKDVNVLVLDTEIYSHCIMQGIDMSRGMEEQRKAVESGAWVLYRHNPELLKEGKNPLTLDSREPSMDIGEYMNGELRFRALKQTNPEDALRYVEKARVEAKRRYELYKHLAGM